MAGMHKLTLLILSSVVLINLVFPVHPFPSSSTPSPDDGGLNLPTPTGDGKKSPTAITQGKREPMTHKIIMINYLNDPDGKPLEPQVISRSVTTSDPLAIIIVNDQSGGGSQSDVEIEPVTDISAETLEITVEKFLQKLKLRKEEERREKHKEAQMNPVASDLTAPEITMKHDLTQFLGLPKHMSLAHFQELPVPLRNARAPVDGVRKNGQVQQQALDSPSDYSKAKLSAVAPPKPQSPHCGPNQDNCVKTSKVYCEGDTRTVMIQFAHPFRGLMRLGSPYKGCIAYKPHNEAKDTVILNINPESCTHAMEPGSKGDFSPFRVNIQFDEEMVTNGDVNFIAQCTPGHSYAKEIAFRYTVMDPIPKANQEKRSAHSRPTITDFVMEIKSGLTPLSPPLNEVVSVGRPLTVVLRMKAFMAKLNLKILSCWASRGEPTKQFTGRMRGYDSHAGEALNLELASNGCSIRPKVFGNFVRMYAGPEDLVYYAPMRAFRFVDSDTLMVKCKVAICYGECPGPKTPCSGTFFETLQDQMRLMSQKSSRHPQSGSEDQASNIPMPIGRDGGVSTDDEARVGPIFLDPKFTKAWNMYLHGKPIESSNVTNGTDSRDKRGVRVIEAQPINFGMNDAEQQTTVSRETHAVMVDIKNAVLWTKCQSDSITAVLNDAAGFTGDVSVVSRSINQRPTCQVLKSFNKDFRGLVTLPKSTCDLNESSQFLVRLSSKEGHTREGLLDCLKSFLVLEAPSDIKRLQ